MREQRPIRSLAEKEARGLRPPGYVRRCLELGRYDAEAGLVYFTPEAWLQLREEFPALNRSLLPNPTPTPNLTPETLAARRAACALCPWNMDGICEHPGCLPCVQKENGGLKWKTAQPTETCPAQKW